MHIKDWNKFQHFKNRKPIWIKLYRELLNDPDWYELSGEDAKSLVMLWLLASEDCGKLPDIRKISFRLRLSVDDVEPLLKRLHHWVYQDDINSISKRYHLAIPETETETETETEKEDTRDRIYNIDTIHSRARR